MTIGVIAGYPELHVLDYTVPLQVRAFEHRVELSTTAAALLEINAFDQLNLQEHKDYTKKYLEAFTRDGVLPDYHSIP